MTLYQDDRGLYDTIAAMERTLEDLEQERDATLARGRVLDTRCDDLTRAIAGLRQEMTAGADDAIPPVNLEGCRNMGDRLHRIALVAGGTVDIAKALDVMERSWPTNAKRDTLRKDINTWIRKHPEDWEKLKPGVYLYRRYEEGEEATKEDH